VTAPVRAQRRRRSAGFTLIELTVALLAGLIVAMAVVGLSRDATHTFHEEMRSSAAEASLRTAMDRLRSDLQRAGYMSTGNIIMDPMIAHAPGASNVSTISTTMNTGLLRLASIYRVAGGSPVTALALSTANNVAPDLLQIGGNMTSADQFDVESIAQAGTPAGGAGTDNCTRIWLSPTSPAMLRALSSGATTATSTLELSNIFRPVPSTDVSQFIVRLVDDTGHTQYLATCPSATAVGFASTGVGGTTGAQTPYVDVDNTLTPIITARTARTNGGVSGFAAGVAWLNPVQVVRWEITTVGASTDPEPAQYGSIAGQPLAPTTADPNKYDLMRSYVDALGSVIPSTSEIVAEYAVDLAFAFSVDTSVDPLLPSIVTYGFEDPTHNDLWAPDVYLQNQPATTVPQRIRMVRVRLVTRAAEPDRSVNVAATNFGTQKFMYRYKIDANDFARARTMVTEVALNNQTRNYY
jgi:Tfp pilus assembly protein PilW